MDMNSIILPAIIFAAVGIVAAAILFIAAKFMAVKVDKRAADTREALPGVNCGACGYIGCDDYAKALADDSEGAIKINLCTPGGDTVAKKLAEILGRDFEDVEEKVAYVACKGDRDTTTNIMDYKGLASCAACNTLYQGKGLCNFACLGYGDCVAVCKYGAISIVGGLAIIDRTICVGCGLCTSACPNNLIHVVPQASKVFVGCSNTTVGSLTRGVCSVGCIGCKICEKKCPEAAVKVENHVAIIDQSKCTKCMICKEACPRKIIFADN